MTFFFVRRFQIISSNLLDIQRYSFSASTFRCRHDFCVFLVSKEFDIEWKFCSRYKAFYQFQNATLNLKSTILDLRATTKRRRRDKISSIVNKFIWLNVLSFAMSSWFVFFFTININLMNIEMWFELWFIFDLVMQWINFSIVLSS
jgi:hypothetical protein